MTVYETEPERRCLGEGIVPMRVMIECICAYVVNQRIIKLNTESIKLYTKRKKHIELYNLKTHIIYRVFIQIKFFFKRSLFLSVPGCSVG